MRHPISIIALAGVLATGPAFAQSTGAKPDAKKAPVATAQAPANAPHTGHGAATVVKEAGKASADGARATARASKHVAKKTAKAGKAVAKKAT